jgi:L-iditol 2-dehydrogenase
MKAAVLEGIDQLVVKEVPDYKVGLGEVLVRVKTCAVCGSDLRIMHSGNPRVKYPQIVGHEIAGEVVEVGAGVERLGVGDRVAVGADVPCGKCCWCQNGMGTNCAINYAVGYQFPGGFAEYILLNELTVNQQVVNLIPDTLSFDEASLAEPLACAINGLEMSQLGVGDTLCIIGAGPIGCMMIELGRHMGATNIIVIQRSQKRLDMAKKRIIERSDYKIKRIILLCEQSDSPASMIFSLKGLEQ